MTTGFHDCDERQLTRLQREIFFQSLAFPKSGHGNIGGWIDIKGVVDPQVYRRATSLLSLKHRFLTATFALRDGHPVQRMGGSDPVDIEILDFRHSGGKAACQAFADEEFRRPFDILNGASPWLCRLLIAEDEQFYAFLKWHHIIADGLSVGLMISDIQNNYNRIIAGEEPDLTPAPSSIEVEKEETANEAARRAKGLAYWMNLLPSAPEPLFARAPDPPMESGRVRRIWPWEQYAQVEALAATWGVPISALLLAALAVSLSFRLGRRPLVIGTPLHGRTTQQDRIAVGPFVNVIPVPINVVAGATLREMVERVAADSRRHYRHHGTTLGELAREWGRAQDPNDPLDVTFSYEPALYAPVDGCECHVSSMSARSQMRGLQVYVRRYADGEDVLFDMDAGLHAPGEAFATAVTGDVLRLLAAAREQHDVRIESSTLLPASERAQAIALGSGVGQTASRPVELSTWFDAVAAREFDRVAVTCGDASLTYDELDRRSFMLAQRLRVLGVGAEVRVGLACERGLDLVVGILAIVRAGGAYVPLDPAYPQTRLSYIVRDSALGLIVADDAGRVALGSLDVTIVPVAAGGHVPQDVSLPAIDPDQAAYVIYTSGSTGEPKGCAVSHRNVARLFASCEAWLTPERSDVWTMFHSYAFDFSVWELWGALLYGGTLVVVPHNVARDPAALLELVRSRGVTVLSQTPSAFRQLAATEAQSAQPPATALRWVVFGGEALEPAMLAGWLARHPEAPRLMNMYGITETTVHVTTRELGAAEVMSGEASLIGRALADLQLLVLDENLDPVPAGATGELCVGGAGVSRGYLGRAALTASRFVPNPYGAPGSRLYRSGDLGRRRAGGDVEYLGRADQQVKIRGFRIELGEVEAAILRHDGIANAAVQAQPGPAGPRLVAYVVSRNGPVDLSSLRTWLSGRLPEYLIPAALVPLAQLPLTANGKLDREALPAPELTRDTQGGLAGGAPEGAVETLLAGIWCDVLGLQNGAIGRDDNFFASGGDSIVALRLIAQAKRHGLRISLRELYESPDLRTLASHVSHDDGTTADAALPAPFELLSAADRALLPADAQDAYPLTGLQAGMLFHSDLTPDVPVFHDIFGFDLELPWREGGWNEAARALTAHPALRTAFAWTLCSQPVQIVYAATSLPVTVVDLRNLPEAEQTQTIAAWLAAEKQRPFDVTAPPLFRLTLHRLSSERTRLSISFHHAILDGWSLASLVTELVSGYVRPERRAAAPPSLQGALVAAERAAIALPENREFWTPRLSGGAHGDRGMLPEASGNGPVRRITSTLESRLTQGLAARSAALGVPLKILLLAAHLRVAALFAHEQRVSTGYVVNVRPEVEGSSAAVGLFLNTVPMTIDLPAGSWTKLVQAVQAEDIALLPHRGVPTVELKRWGDGRLPYASGFNFVHFHVYEALLALPGLTVHDVDVFEQTDFPFLCQFTLNPAYQTLELSLVARDSQLSDARAALLRDLYVAALENIAWTPERNWQSMPLLSEAQRTEAIALSSGAGEVAARPAELGGWFAGVAAREADRVAVRCGDVSLTYGELDRRSKLLAQRLRALGVGAEMRVGLACERGVDLVVGVLAIVRAGAAYVPLDPAYPQARLSYIVGDSALRLVVADDAGRTALAALDVPIVPVTSSPEIDAHDVGLPAIDPDQAAYVIYTSGSTGEPKGCVVSHRNVARLFASCEGWLAPGRDDVWALFHSYAFDFSVWELWGALLYGGCLIVVPREVTRDARAVLDLVRSSGVTVLSQTPSAFRQFAAAEAELTQPASLALRWVVFGGEALEPAMLAGWLVRHPDAPRLMNMYGITETTVHVTARALTAAEICAGEASLVGHALGDLQLLLLDDALEPVPVGAVGELCVGGAGVSRGYLGRAALTASRFLPNPYGAAGSRLYRSGDLGRRRADGDVEYLGRADQQVKIRGFRIELGEIEAALLGHAGIADAAVKPVAAPAGPRLVGYVVSRNGALDLPAVRSWLANRLPEHLVPSALVPLARLPLTANGKLDRAALPAPEPSAVGPGGPSGGAPEGPLEQQLAGLWAEVLGLPAGAPIGREDNFFASGGDSIVAARLAARVRSAFAVDLRLQALFSKPTFAAVASEIAGLKAAPPKVPVRRAVRSAARVPVGAGAREGGPS